MNEVFHLVQREAARHGLSTIPGAISGSNTSRSRDLLAWGSRPGWFGAINDWWLQLAVLLVLLLLYATPARTTRIQPAAVAASSALLIGIQLLTLFPCIGY